MEDVLRPTQVPKSKDYKHASMKILLQIALADLPSPPSDSSPGSSKENDSRQMNGEDLSEKEAKQLRAIKRLIEIKGYDNMIKFLES